MKCPICRKIVPLEGIEHAQIAAHLHAHGLWLTDDFFPLGTRSHALHVCGLPSYVVRTSAGMLQWTTVEGLCVLERLHQIWHAVGYKVEVKTLATTLARKPELFVEIDAAYRLGADAEHVAAMILEAS